MKDQDFVFGRNPVLEMLREGKAFEQIVLQKGIDRDFAEEIRKTAAGLGVPVLVAPREKLNRVTRKNHQGVIGFTSWVEYADLANTIQDLFEKGRNPLILFLDEITDVRNMGAIARSAEVFGAHAIVVPLRGAARIGAVAVKTSAGAITRITLCRVKSLAGAARMAADMGLMVCGADQNAETYLPEVVLSGPCAIVLGSEDKGLSAPVRNALSCTFAIPQVGETESLNVSVATGVILYEVMQQRKTYAEAPR